MPERNTHVCERRAVDDEHEPAGPLAVVVAHERGHAAVHALERVAARLLLVELHAVVLENAALGEEVLDRLEHLRVDGHRALAAAPDDHDVVLAPDQVRAVANG